MYSTVVMWRYRAYLMYMYDVTYVAYIYLYMYINVLRLKRD